MFKLGKLPLINDKCAAKQDSKLSAVLVRYAIRQLQNNLMVTGIFDIFVLSWRLLDIVHNF